MDYDKSWSAGELWSNLLAHRLWLWLLSNATETEKIFVIADHSIPVSTGELITSYSQMAEGIGWSIRGTPHQPTTKQIQGSLSTLISLEMVEIIYDVDEPRKQRWLHLKLLQYPTILEKGGASRDKDKDENISLSSSVIAIAPGEEARQAAVASKAVFTYWIETMGKSANTKLTSERRAAILSALRDGFTVEELKLAIDGCRNSKWHMGHNDDGMLHNDITFICRDDININKFMEMAPEIVAQERRRIKEQQERESRISHAVLLIRAWGQEEEEAARMIVNDDDEWKEVCNRIERTL